MKAAWCPPLGPSPRQRPVAVGGGSPRGSSWGSGSLFCRRQGVGGAVWCLPRGTAMSGGRAFWAQGTWVPGTGKRNARERTGFPCPVLGPGLTPWGLGQELRMPENRAEPISRCGQRRRKEPQLPLLECEVWVWRSSELFSRKLWNAQPPVTSGVPTVPGQACNQTGPTGLSRGTGWSGWT